MITLWHPILVHFSLALLTISAALYAASALSRPLALKDRLLLVARVNLWIGAGASLLTISAGLLAAAHVPLAAAQADTLVAHRNSGLTAAVLWSSLAAWEIRNARAVRRPPRASFLLLLVALGILGIAGWKGGELVFRHGVGVQAVQRS
jgi:uncharacterized membrane protein